jgi:3-oxoacyl-(acyl-carrier-protein) synthase
LNYSNIRAEQIDYILAHGTGTRQNDQLELNALESVLGSGIPVSSTKDRHGHAIAAAGIQEFCILLELMKGSLIPRNLNMKTPCDTNLDLVKEDRESRINYALTSNFAFGGINTVLAVKNELNET